MQKATGIDTETSDTLGPGLQSFLKIRSTVTLRIEICKARFALSLKN